MFSDRPRGRRHQLGREPLPSPNPQARGRGWAPHSPGPSNPEGPDPGRPERPGRCQRARAVPQAAPRRGHPEPAPVSGAGRRLRAPGLAGSAGAPAALAAPPALPPLPPRRPPGRGARGGGSRALIGRSRGGRGGGCEGGGLGLLPAPSLLPICVLSRGSRVASSPARGRCGKAGRGKIHSGRGSSLLSLVSPGPFHTCFCTHAGSSPPAGSQNPRSATGGRRQLCLIRSLRARLIPEPSLPPPPVRGREQRHGEE